ncbi:MAG TPA: FHA domain-containing protein [Planctomycetota bacterium]|nr:FHA domain-containing protein [Planctomycetota bacterium]
MAKVSIFFNGASQKEVLLDKDHMVIGRDPSCQIHLDNLGISRTHCQLLKKGDAFVVQDLKSSNGTFVNGQKVGEHFLNDKDVISFGKFELRFSKEDGGAVASGGSTASGPNPAAAKADADTLNTFVMDGADIQEKIKKMKEAQGGAEGGGGTAAAAFGGKANKPRTAKDFGAALAKEDAPASSSGGGGGNKTIILALAGVVLILIVVVLGFVLGWFGGAKP